MAVTSKVKSVTNHGKRKRRFGKVGESAIDQRPYLVVNKPYHNKRNEKVSLTILGSNIENKCLECESNVPSMKNTDHSKND